MPVEKSAFWSHGAELRAAEDLCTLPGLHNNPEAAFHVAPPRGLSGLGLIFLVTVVWG